MAPRLVDGPLRTDRLLLRPFTSNDAPRVAELCNDAHLARMTGRIPHPYGLKDAETFLSSVCESGEEAVFAITTPADGLIGSIGLKRLAPDIYELGYWLGALWRGQGFVSEAAAAVVDAAWTRFNATRLESGHFLDNLASARVLQKLGFRPIYDDVLWSEGRQAKARGRRYALPAPGQALGVLPEEEAAMRTRAPH